MIHKVFVFLSSACPKIRLSAGREDAKKDPCEREVIKIRRLSACLSLALREQISMIQI